MQGLCGKWEPHLYCLLSSEHVAGPMHSFSCSLNSVDSSSAKPGSFLLQRKHLVPSHKRETQNLLLTCLISTWEGTWRALFPRVPLQLQRHMSFNAAFSESSFTRRTLTQPCGSWSAENSSTSAQILDSNRGLKLDDHCTLIHAHSIPVS